SSTARARTLSRAPRYLDAALDTLLRGRRPGAAMTVAEIAAACGVRDDVIARILDRAMKKIKKKMLQ
ncbi:MAG: hypothetical protein IJI37_05875, partial [Opitutales bacterium]|nr:hypothetical protein [Opitutales bacterium]